MLTMRKNQRRQGGFTLIEGLVAILIFSLGVLALIGLQVNSVRQSSNAKYRSDAALVANRLIGEMWVTDRLVANMQANFMAGGAQYNAWAATVQAVLPGSTGANVPTVVVAANGQVTITVFWKAPNEQAADPVHSYTTIARIQ
jgi:type IV pilus assembly protein PilV